MKEFDYYHPVDIDETLKYLGKFKEKAMILAGGTDLILDLRQDKGVEGVENIINIAHLDQLQYIKEEGDQIKIGAGITHGELAKSKLIQREVPALAQAARTVGSPQIRNLGTIGGNIINASPAADPVPILVALESILTLKSSNGVRHIPITDIYKGPYQSEIKEDELLTEISFRKLPPTATTAFIKLGRRNALAIARMNVAVIISKGLEGIIKDVRIVPGATTPVPMRIKSAEDILLNNQADEELISQAGEKVAEEMIKISGYRWSSEYKKPVIATLTRRGIYEALEGEQ